MPLVRPLALPWPPGAPRWPALVPLASPGPWCCGAPGHGLAPWILALPGVDVLVRLPGVDVYTVHRTGRLLAVLHYGRPQPTACTMSAAVCAT